jgi:hypothetical protein
LSREFVHPFRVAPKKGDGKATVEKKTDDRLFTECPWPFIWLHKPSEGVSSKHMWKNLGAAALLAYYYYTVHYLAQETEPDLASG